MTEQEKTKYKAEYSEKNYDRYTVLFPKGQREVIKKAAAMEGKTLNAFMMDLARAEATKVLDREMSEIKEYTFTEQPAPCRAANVVIYIDCTNTPYLPSEPLRIAVVNFDTGGILYRREFSTIYSNEDKELVDASKPTAEDISLIMGYLECETIFTYDRAKLHSLETWSIDLVGCNIQEINKGMPLMEAIGMKGTNEREVRAFEIAQKLREFAFKTL